jgi:hypothetical protein
MPSHGVAKLSLSVPEDLAQALRRRVSARELEGEREQLGDLLAELDAAAGPVPEPMLREARAAWRNA